MELHFPPLAPNPRAGSATQEQNVNSRHNRESFPAQGFPAKRFIFTEIHFHF
jgi:hypothetical protein